MSDTRLDFRYTPRDVSSAQRMRFLRSSQLKIILLVWVASTLYIIAPLVLPNLLPAGPFSNWAVALQVTLAYTVTLTVLILVTPWAEYYLNRFWRLPLVLRFSEKQLRVSVSGKQGGFRLDWAGVKKVQENERVFILYYGDGNKYIILPKSMFSKPNDERRFRGLLERRASLPKIASGETASDAETDDEEG
jgi:hypothetical protein